MNGFELKGHWHKEFFKNDNPIVLELGCGKGEYTVGLAHLFPDKNFIGVDIKGARMWTGAKDSYDSGMPNVAFLRTSIELISHFFAAGEVAEIWLTFPDPQMKKVNKRLTSTRFMKMYREILSGDGIIHLKTDSNFMYTYTCEMVKANNYPVLFSNNDLYHSGLVDDILSIKTYYEQQWLDRGLNIKYIKFVCEERDELVEPDSILTAVSTEASGAHWLQANKTTNYTIILWLYILNLSWTHLQKCAIRVQEKTLSKWAW